MPIETEPNFLNGAYAKQRYCGYELRYFNSDKNK